MQQINAASIKEKAEQRQNLFWLCSGGVWRFSLKHDGKLSLDPCVC